MKNTRKSNVTSTKVSLIIAAPAEIILCKKWHIGNDMIYITNKRKHLDLLKMKIIGHRALGSTRLHNTINLP